MAGRSPDGSGSRPSGRAADGVSPVPASIPNALDKLRTLRVMFEACNQPLYVQVADEVLSELETTSSDTLRALVSVESIERLAADIACAIVEPRKDLVALRHNAMVRLGERLRNPYSRDVAAAQAIEARRAETLQDGSVHESAVGTADAPNPGQSSGMPKGGEL
jgi:hypothetical protein